MENCYFSISPASWLHEEHGVVLELVLPGAFKCPHHDKHFVQEALRIVVGMKIKHCPELVSCVRLVVEDIWAELHGTRPELHVRHK